MKLGTIEVDEYVGKEIDVEPDRGRKAMLTQMRENPYGNEKDVLQHFEFLEFASTTNLREISLNFLSMSKKFKGEGFKKVPEFAVYLLKKHGAQFKFDDCTIHLSSYGDLNVSLKEIWSHHLLKGCRAKTEQKTARESPSNSHIFAAGEPSWLGMNTAAQVTMMQREMAARMVEPPQFISRMPSFDLTSSFSGVITPSAKEKIEEADKCFEETTLITMANWQEKKIQTDPLIVSIYNGKAYLIDHFDTSQVENYVLSEFLL